MKNKKIRIAMVEAEIKQWQLAIILKKHEGSVSRMLRDELPEEEQNRIVEIIRNNTKKEMEQ